MQNIENIPGLMSIVAEKKNTAEIATLKWLDAIKRVDSAVRNEWNHKLDDLKNKKYLLVNPMYFNVASCLIPRNSGDNFKYMRFIENINGWYALTPSPIFDYVFEFDGESLKDIFGTPEKYSEYRATIPSFAEYFDESAKYLVFCSYGKNGIGLDLFKNLYEYIIIKI